MRACWSRYFSSLYNMPRRLTCCQKLNEHCFERCVPKPGTSLSKGEEGCFTNCMEKYMSAWNTVSKQYVARIQRESRNQMGAGLSM
jgi:import inner membrane translocase subunit TIM13